MSLLFKSMQKYITLIITYFVCAASVTAQLNIINPDTVITTNYGNSELQDSIYVFYGPGAGGWDLEMKATACEANNLQSTFKWSAFNYDAEGYWTTLKIDSVTTVSDFSTTQSGIYQMQMTNSLIDTTYFFLLFADNMRARLFNRPDCDELKIQGLLTTPQFRYRNRHISPPLEMTYNNPVQYVWKLQYLDPITGEWLTDTVRRTFLPQFSPRIVPIPREQQYYRVIAFLKDTLGHAVADTMVYQSISVEAGFIASISGREITADEKNIKGQAPFKVQFKNLSKNAISYEWSLWNSSESLPFREDTVWRTLYNFEPLDSIEYIQAGSYTVKLKATGRTFISAGEEKTCISVDSILNYITVYNSALGELPNVFTPSGDGINDRFIFKDSETSQGQNPSGNSQSLPPTRSLQHIELYVYSRGGDKVYEYIGDDDDWEGWDGRRMGRGVKVQPGIYFYVISGQGWDGVKHKARGFVHVYH